MTPPFVGVITEPLADGVTFHPDFVELRQNADRRCIEAGICKHDMQHSLRATQNGLAILGMFQNSPQLAPIANTLTTKQIAFVMHTHDLGYGSDVEIVEFQHVDNHEQQSWAFVERAVQKLSPQHPTRRYIETHQDLFQTGIAGTEKEHTEIIENAIQNPTPPNLFLLLIDAAGKADYFIRHRVDHLHTPTDYTTNPYHALAFAVDTYQLTCDSQHKTLTYSVQLAKDNNLIDNPSEWLQLVKKDYPSVLALLKICTQLAGYTLVVEATN